MYTRFLFPHRFQKVGWILFITGIIGGLILLYLKDYIPKIQVKVLAIYNSGFPFENIQREWFTFITHNPFDEIISICLVIGAIFIACSREKTEDEFISKIRLESLLWATYVNYGLLLLSIIFIYGTIFWNVMIYDMFTILILFTFRFKYVLYKSKKAAINEK
jgi:hypothetical protein